MFLYLDHPAGPGDPGDPDRGERAPAAAAGHVRDPDADPPPDRAHPDLVPQGALEGLRVPGGQQEAGADRPTQATLRSAQHLQGKGGGGVIQTLAPMLFYRVPVIVLCQQDILPFPQKLKLGTFMQNGESSVTV